MKATIQRVRESVSIGTFFRVSCLDHVITTKFRYFNGEHVILVEGNETFLLKLSKLFDFCPDQLDIHLEIGDDVTAYIPADLFS